MAAHLSEFIDLKLNTVVLVQCKVMSYISTNLLLGQHFIILLHTVKIYHNKPDGLPTRNILISFFSTQRTRKF